MPFDPDAYLKTAPAKPTSGFDPDAYLSGKTAAAPPARPAAPEDTGRSSTQEALKSGIRGLSEAGLSMATGMIAKPVSDVAGLAALAKEIISPTPGGGDPSGFKRSVQEALTYEPQSRAGQAVAKYNPAALMGRGVDWLGGQAEGMIAPPPGARDVSPLRVGLASGVHEAINQAPGLLGVKYGPKAAEATGEATQEAGRGLMQSALKPTLKSLQRGDAQRAIDTMLEQGVNVSKGGVSKLQDRISTLNDQIDARVSSSKLSVNKHAVANNLKDTLADFQRQVDASKDVASIQQVYDNFMKHPLTTGRVTIPVPLAQEMKRGTYKQLSGKYGELSSADMEAQKALARGLKEEIAKAIPDIKPLNAEESRLLNTLPIVERRVLMSANKNPAGLGILASSPEKFAAWLADRSDLFKSLVARMLYKGGEKVKGAGPALASGGLAASQYAGQIPPPPNTQAGP